MSRKYANSYHVLQQHNNLLANIIIPSTSVAPKDFYLDQNTIPLTLLSPYSSIFVLPKYYHTEYVLFTLGRAS